MGCDWGLTGNPSITSFFFFSTGLLCTHREETGLLLYPIKRNTNRVFSVLCPWHVWGHMFYLQDSEIVNHVYKSVQGEEV